MHDAVEAFTHAEAKKKAAAEAARDAAAAPKAAKAKAKAPAASPAGAVVLHAEKAWPPTAWPRAVRMLVAGALGGAVSKTATAPIETVRLNVMVGTGGATPTPLESLLTLVAKSPLALRQTPLCPLPTSQQGKPSRR